MGRTPERSECAEHGINSITTVSCRFSLRVLARRLFLSWRSFQIGRLPGDTWFSLLIEAFVLSIGASNSQCFDEFGVRRGVVGGSDVHAGFERTDLLVEKDDEPVHCFPDATTFRVRVDDIDDNLVPDLWFGLGSSGSSHRRHVPSSSSVDGGALFASHDSF